MNDKIQQAFDNIHADTRLKNATKWSLALKRRRKARRKTILILIPSFLALFLVIALWGYTWIRTPVAYVSIDVNPSMELALNSLDRVVSVYAYNTEGAEILDGLSLIGSRYTEAVKNILSSSAMGPYLAENSDLVFTVAADKDREELLESELLDTSRYMGQNCHSAHTDMEMVSQAHDNGLSLGKYSAYLQLLQYDDTVTVDQCRDMSMAEIHQLIWQYQRGDGSRDESEDGYEMEYENETDYEDETDHEDETDYEDETDHEDETDYEDETDHENETPGHHKRYRHRYHGHHG